MYVVFEHALFFGTKAASLMLITYNGFPFYYTIKIKH